MKASRKDESALNDCRSEVSLTGEAKYAPTKIKIVKQWQQPEALSNHPIQKLFTNYNEFIKIVFTQRSEYEKKYKEYLPHLLRLAKRLGLTLIKGQLMPANLKTREQCNALKEKILFCWCRILNEQNQFDQETYSSIFAGKQLNENTKTDLERDN